MKHPIRRWWLWVGMLVWCCGPGAGCVQAGVASDSAAGEGPIRVIVFGAHPDDAEIKAGGVAARWAARGHAVKFVATTNGDIGHARMGGGELARRRRAEVEEAARVLGIGATEVLDIHDGELMPTLENRREIVRLIREWRADLVISHRPNDYHPDHRYTGILVQDAAFMVIVSQFLPTVPQLARNPVFMFCEDGFQKPNVFEADVVVSIDETIEKKVEALWALESQVESLWATGDFERVVPVPADAAGRAARRAEVTERFKQRAQRTADRFRDRLIELYGEEAGRKVRYAEAFELCEYGRQASPVELRRLFPFFE
jgi:N-acetylglucosamine malate deacetylase 1